MTAIVLAAGQGTRMKSAKPKVLHELCGKPMIHYVVESALASGADEVVVVVGFGRDEVTRSLEGAFGPRVKTALQDQQRGTGHAVGCALPSVSAGAELILILCGDTPLVAAGDLTRMSAAMQSRTPLAMLTFTPPDTTGYGRIVRDAEGRIVAIREHRDCTPEELAIRSANPGMYLVRASFLREAIGALSSDNAQGELYLTDVVADASRRGGVAEIVVADAQSLVGVNDRAQLAALEDAMYARIADHARRDGATVRTSARIDASVVIERDAVIEHHVVLRGVTRIGEGARIDVGSVLTDVTVESYAELKPYTIATSSKIGEKAQIGPFSHLRPESVIEDEAHVGNFVETKKTILRRGAKANHLAYLGDGDIGEGANIGAGTIFCNYDGFVKHRTEIGAGAFIGSDSQLVAPIKIGEGAYVATGTTVTRDVPADALAIARLKQENKEGYASRLKARLKAAKTKP
jgi:bifunctional UDP-N-acetylglucosamine pyrophosphorylase/glucosamine-1-phosphate N-acetyltransferase